MVRQLLALLSRLRLLAVLCVSHKHLTTQQQSAGALALTGAGGCGLRGWLCHPAAEPSWLGLLTGSWLATCHLERCMAPAGKSFGATFKVGPDSKCVVFSRPWCCPQHRSMRVHPLCCCVCDPHACMWLCRVRVGVCCQHCAALKPFVMGCLSLQGWLALVKCQICCRCDPDIY